MTTATATETAAYYAVMTVDAIDGELLMLHRDEELQNALEFVQIRGDFSLQVWVIFANGNRQRIN